MVEARTVADSLNPVGDRLTTFVLTYPRFIHAELMTHRVFSRNSASSRAIPVKKMIEMVKTNPVIPEYWGKNQKGMQAKEELTGWKKKAAEFLWLRGRDVAVMIVKGLLKLDLHKQIANRLLEPWMHITVLVSSTEFDNWFKLRDHQDAQPEMQTLAKAMRVAQRDSIPKRLAAGEWHLPFADQFLDDVKDIGDLLRISTARAARLSYLTFEGNIDYEKDYALHDQLLESGHWSPFEHSAKAMDSHEWSGNFRGFFQYRKQFLKESGTPPDNERYQRQHREAELSNRNFLIPG
jgi:thymidylate synthase ThyX